MKTYVARLAAACAACMIAAPAVVAQTPPHGELAGPDDPHGGPPALHAHPRFGGHGHGGGALAGLRGLDLTEAQRDRIFAIVHENVPKRRELDKKERQARLALRDMAGAPQVDLGKASSHARALREAVADEAMLRLKQEAAVMAVLTPEQRAQLEQRRAQPRRDRS